MNINRELNYLIVGGDGLIGSSLYRFLVSQNVSVYITTRRNVDLAEHESYLDLTDCRYHAKVLDFPVNCVFLCASVTSIAACEENSLLTRKVNVDGTLSLVNLLNERGVRVVFLSSNTVFDGINIVDEYSDTCPNTEYGKQKADVESILLKMNNVAIVRLSKVMSPTSGIASDFLKKLSAGEELHAFQDLRMSPVSLKYVVESLVKIAQSVETGIFHLSSETELSYAEFAYHFAARLNVSRSKIKPISSLSAGINVLFNPVHPALGMTRTLDVLGIMPESISHVFDQLIGNSSKCRK